MPVADGDVAPGWTAGRRLDALGDIVTFSQQRGIERSWVPRDEEAYWVGFWGRQGVPAARWRDYLAWGRRFYPPTGHGIRGYEVLRPAKRKRTNYRVWRAPS